MTSRLFAGLAFAVLLAVNAAAQQPSNVPWRFAVSGDSRNCGDVVMPAIAKSVLQQDAQFYWHLGDYRAIYDFDQDYRQLKPKATISQYESDAWPDFIEHQLKPFGDLPVFLGMGNHETIPPKTRPEFLAQFADWLLTPALRMQRLADDPSDHKLRAYNHWIEHNVEMINLDNASEDQFDDDQLKWFKRVLDRAAKEPTVQSVVVGMHEALPDSLSAGHSMNESARGTLSGRAVYDQLVAFRRSSAKPVYVLASHAHFFMSDVYATACRAKDDVLPGWIVGTAGAVRYRLPKGVAESKDAIPDTYGYLLGTAASDGTISFVFKKIVETDVPDPVVRQYSQEFVHKCFDDNKSTYVPDGPICDKARQ